MIDGYTHYMLRRRRSPKTIKLRLHYLYRFQNWYGRDLATATYDDLDGFVHHSPTWSQSSQQSATASIRAMYTWATSAGFLERNPAADLPHIRVHRKRQRIASETAIQQAILCDNLSDRAMVLLGAECGLRVFEIATLHRDSREGDWLRIIGKGGKQRMLHLSPELETILDEIEATTMRHGWYFPGQSGIRPIHETTAWRHISTVLHSNPHSLRRRAGTVVYRASGHDIRLAQVFLGHSQSSTTEMYLEIGDDLLVTASNLTRIAA